MPTPRALMTSRPWCAPPPGGWCLLDLPTDSPWLNPLEMLWRQFRREVTHGELFASVHALLQAAQEFFARYTQCPQRMLSIIGSHAA
jgi:putative transposase